jgi:hypothetical protein
MNVFFIKGFLSSKKVKRVVTETDENGEMKTTQIYASSSDISKYSDAINWAVLMQMKCCHHLTIIEKWKRSLMPTKKSTRLQRKRVEQTSKKQTQSQAHSFV